MFQFVARKFRERASRRENPQFRRTPSQIGREVLLVPLEGLLPMLSLAVDFLSRLLHQTLLFLFRFFDIIKPYPIDVLEKRLPGGWGIVMDDVLAGIYTNICLRILARFLCEA